MSTAAMKGAVSPESLAERTEAAVATLDRLLDLAAQRVRVRVSKDGGISSQKMEEEQRATHGLAWLATYVESLRQLDAYARRLKAQDRYGVLEDRIVQLGFSEYLAQIFGGIAMNQGETVRPADLGIGREELQTFRTADIETLIEAGNSPEIRSEITRLIRAQAGHSTFGDPGLDETMEQIRNEMRRFAEDTVVPNAHEWHLKNEYIPLDVINQMSELGVFGLTIPEEYGGLGLGKEAMCVVSEELSRAYIGVGSLGTRSEIAAELILCGGTDEQKQHWLPKIASGEVLPTAVFTEPNTGSDLASLKTRAVREGDAWKISGNKTWITHPVRADIMTLLARTNPQESGYKGLSMFIAEKPRGTDEDPFPAEGMSGGEIEVLGYRGMKEYEIAFDGFEVGQENLLGQVEGEGFKQLMQTFEGARIQTAARALGVAQSALDLGLRYAEERIQFGKSLISFPRVSDKLAMMTAELMIARQLTYFSSWQKDSGKRCDLEAGMAKLLGARVAWAAADNALQIHGGNGFALEYAISRVLCDARILNIFEGAAEIQAQVIARRLLETRGNA
ncbi:acyl-CoA dehydrogenase family protein [Roseibium salinum]|uniref:Acyl-CoA dehydrogenase family protein n=1 Tax=Roseibium salinum TaxID=1604349 RepID=A0ABT3R7R2_9HYPH|nr:acyl-CoA dehydrogenase family protein [Roseibium sp. DSM 29163]MCX2725192.1 acyl-CoA dehydrogenase family protein [Roseibium sp. DSM 29163]